MKPFNRLFSRSLAVLFLSVAGAWAALADPVTITAQPNPAIAGETIVFTITPKIYPNDRFSITFGDNTPTLSFQFHYDPDMGWIGPCHFSRSCGSVAHVYSAPGTYTVSFEGKIGVSHDGTGGMPFSGTLHVTVVSAMGIRGIFVPTAAHLTGHNNVLWRTDLEVQNPGSAQARYSIALLARGEDNSNPAHADLTLDPGKSARYADILQTLFGFSGAAALCIVPVEGTVVATSRTYAESGSGTYGSFVPAVARDNAIALGEDGRLIGLSHDPSLAAGFRTNVGIVNANEYPLTIDADFYLASGTLLGTASYGLQAFEFRQIDGAFEQFTRDPVEDGYVVVRMASGAGGQMLDATAKFFAYASVIDNLTGDPTYVPAITTAPPEGDISGSWTGTFDSNDPGDCPTHTPAQATFTQNGLSVNGVLSFGQNCGQHEVTFHGSLYGSALVGSDTNGSFTGTVQGTLSGDSLELALGRVGGGALWRGTMHLHR